MSNEFINVSKKDIIDFARIIYSRAVCGYEDLEDSICLSESHKFYNKFKDVNSVLIDSTSNLTVSNNNPNSTWTFSSSSDIGSIFFDNNPLYDHNLMSCTVPAQNIGFSSPYIAPNRQLLLFEDLDSNTSRNFDEEVSISCPQSNEGHIYL